MARRTMKQVEAELAAAMRRIEELQAALAAQGSTNQPTDYKARRAYVCTVAERAASYYGKQHVFQSIKYGRIGIRDSIGRIRWGAVERMDAHLTAKGL